MAARKAGQNPNIQALLQAASPGLAAGLLAEVVGLGDIVYGEEQGLTGEIPANLLAMQLPTAGAAVGAALAARVDPTVRLFMDGMIRGEKAAEMGYVKDPAFMRRLTEVLKKREAQIRANPVPGMTAMQQATRGTARRLGAAASIGAVTASLPALAAMVGDWPGMQNTAQEVAS